MSRTTRIKPRWNSKKGLKDRFIMCGCDDDFGICARRFGVGSGPRDKRRVNIADREFKKALASLDES